MANPSLYERLRDDGEIRLNGPVDLMRFTLIYDGPLPAQNGRDGRTDVKHRMREAFHSQLAELWSERRYLKEPLEQWRKWPALREQWLQLGAAPDMSHRAITKAVKTDIDDAMRSARSRARSVGPYESPPVQQVRIRTDNLERLEASERFGVVVPFDRGPFTFFPLATKRWDLVCDLEILFLRAEKPGALFPNTRGDLDNRLKVLFDALTMPEHAEQLPKGVAPEATQDPFFCLLEDDKLITSFRVNSERLLDVPPGGNHVKLVIGVTVKTRRVNLVTLELEGD